MLVRESAGVFEACAVPESREKGHERAELQEGRVTREQGCKRRGSRESRVAREKGHESAGMIRTRGVRRGKSTVTRECVCIPA
jgi:hypothetical protein